MVLFPIPTRRDHLTLTLRKGFHLEAMANKTPKFSGVIVTFHPDEDIIENVESWLKQLSVIYLVDNGSSPETLAYLMQITDARVEKIFLGRNTGIAHALNVGVRRAKSDNYKWVVTIDQDSTPCGNYSASMGKFILQHNEHSTLAMVGSAIRERSSASESQSTSQDVNIAGMVITSGTCTNIEAIESAGWFREDLFIDLVDFDMCLRLKHAGFNILVNHNASISHEFGQAVVRSILGRQISLQEYGATRIYYRFRNAAILIRDYYKNHPKWVLKRVYILLKLSVFILFFYQKRFFTMKFAIKGLIDGIKYNI